MGVAVIVLKFHLFRKCLPNALKFNLVLCVDRAVMASVVDECDFALSRIRQTAVQLLPGFERFGKIQHAAPHPDNGTGSKQIVGVLVEQFEPSEISRFLILRYEGNLIA